MKILAALLVCVTLPAAARPVFDAEARCTVVKPGDRQELDRKCFAGALKGQLARYRDRVRRRGKVLKLKIDNKKRWLRLVDSNDESNVDAWVTYFFHDYLEDVGLYVLEENYYESKAWSVVDARTGKKIVLDSVPLVAPGGTRLAAAGLWCNTDGNDSKAVVLELGQRPPKASWKWSEENAGFRVVRWISEEALELERLDCGGYGDDWKPRGKLELRRGADGAWTSKDLPKK